MGLQEERRVARLEAKDKLTKHDERHWTQKPLEDMTDRDWRILKEDYNIATRGMFSPVRPVGCPAHDSSCGCSFLHCTGYWCVLIPCARRTVPVQAGTSHRPSGTGATPRCARR